MQELEKILEDLKEVFEQNIVKELNGDGTVDKYSLNPWHTWSDIGEVICKYMNDDWIPVEKYLPKEGVNPITNDFYEYQVTAKFGECIDIRHYKFGRGHWWHGPAIVDKYVIAWQPLPDPYKPGNNQLDVIRRYLNMSNYLGEMDKIKLKTCPFCGGEAKLCHPHVMMIPIYWVECKKCKSESYTYRTKEEAAKAWNRRKAD